MKSQFDYILIHIKHRGLANREAIAAHRSVKAGERGIRTAKINKAIEDGAPIRKRGTQGILGHKRKRVKSHHSEQLPMRHDYGTPIITDGTKGYIRDRITGVITRCVSTL